MMLIMCRSVILECDVCDVCKSLIRIPLHYYVGISHVSLH